MSFNFIEGLGYLGALFVGLDTPLKVHCNLNFMKKTLKYKSNLYYSANTDSEAISFRCCISTQ